SGNESGPAPAFSGDVRAETRLPCASHLLTAPWLRCASLACPGAAWSASRTGTRHRRRGIPGSSRLQDFYAAIRIRVGRSQGRVGGACEAYPFILPEYRSLENSLAGTAIPKVIRRSADRMAVRSRTLFLLSNSATLLKTRMNSA